jgi:hypothetical protein
MAIRPVIITRWNGRFEAIYDNYDFGHPIGFGATEVEAILDLVCPDIIARVRDQVIEIVASTSRQTHAR